MSLISHAAPKSAALPPVTREIVAIWEKELDDFVGDIRSRLDNVAESISQLNQPMTAPTTDLQPMKKNVSQEADVLINAEVSEQPGFRSENLTDDPLQAIKQKLAARLQGESS